MEDNIFFKKNKLSKNNPDIIENHNKKDNLRNCVMYELKKEVYNPITNIIPNKVSNQKDLELKETKKDNLDKLLQDKINERNNINCNTNKKITQNNSYGIRESTFNQLKNEHNLFNNKRSKKKKNKDDVLESLKELGILN